LIKIISKKNAMEMANHFMTINEKILAQVLKPYS